MKVEIKQSFEKDLKNIKDKKLLERILKVIEKIENAKTLNEIPNFKKLTDYKQHYRIRIGDYRIGIEIKDSIIYLVRFLNKNTFYKYFP